jgi:hypothetical protein
MWKSGRLIDLEFIIEACQGTGVIAVLTSLRIRFSTSTNRTTAPTRRISTPISTETVLTLLP